MVPLPVAVALPGTRIEVVLIATTVVLLSMKLVCTVTPEGGQGVPTLVGAEDETGTPEVEGAWSIGLLMAAAEDVMAGSTGIEMKVAAMTVEAEKSAGSARALMGAIS
jgi:hypothetical protein